MRATLEQVRAVPTPAPVGIWHPVGHERFLNEIDEAVDEIGLEVTGKQFDLMNDGDRLFGTYAIGGFDCHDVPGGVGFKIGFKGSIDKSLSQAIAYGTDVFVCSNGMFAGERIISRKNTTHALTNLWLRIRQALSGFEAFRNLQTKQYKRLAETPLTDMQAHDFVCRAIRKGRGAIVGRGKDIADLLDEWHKPKHDFGGKTAWCLHNAFTEIAKDMFELNPVTAAARTISLDSMFTREFASDLPKLEEVAPLIEN